MFGRYAKKYICVSSETHYVYQEKLEEMMAFLDAKEYITVKSLSDFPEFEGKPEEDCQKILRVTYGSREFEARMADPLTIKATLKESNKGDQTLLNSFLGLKSFMLQYQFHELDKLGLSKKELEEAGIGLVAGMMIMGKALTPLLAKYFPSDEYFRFSIHAHPFEGKKFTILLLPVRVKKQTIKKLNTSSLGVCNNEALDVSEIKSAVLGGQKVAPPCTSPWLSSTESLSTQSFMISTKKLPQWRQMILKTRMTKKKNCPPLLRRSPEK